MGVFIDREVTNIFQKELNTMKLTWMQTIKLGKNVVSQKLDNYGKAYDRSDNYFKLCSLLYKHEKQLHSTEDTHTEEAQEDKGCVGVTVETVKVRAEQSFTIAQLMDYRQRYLSMRSYCLDWFDRAYRGKIGVPGAIIKNAELMWNHYHKSDRYSQLKMVYDYCYRFDYVSKSNHAIVV